MTIQTTKVCAKCRFTKPLDQFHKNRSRSDGLHPHCRDCKKSYYDSEKNHAGFLKYITRNREYVWNYLDSHPCVDCDEDDIIVLEFDHIDGEDKDKAVSVGVANRWSLERLQIEIDKCEVRCANCHRRKTAFQDNWHITRRK